MSAATVRWALTMTATSSIAHGEETRGGTTQLRRESVVQPDGRVVEVPIVSGNALRGRLRRIGEELLRDALAYEGELSVAAAHALRAGGSLAKTTGEPLSGRRLARLRSLVPQVGVFGCAGGGRIIDGCLQVGKVVPHLLETAHLAAPGTSAAAAQNAFHATQFEFYARADDSNDHAFSEVLGVHRVDVDEGGRPVLEQLPDRTSSRLMRFEIETLPAGTALSSWARIERATPLEVAFFTEVLETFAADGRLGGRLGIGHGHVRVEVDRTLLAGADPAPVPWRTDLVARRAEVLEALAMLT